MVFEDLFMDKQSEIVSLYAKNVNADIDMIYIYIFTNDYQCTLTTGFKRDNNLVFTHDAGISSSCDDEIFDTIIEEILPGLSDICEDNNVPMPVEFKLIYNTKTGSFESSFKYENDIGAEYDCDQEGYKWIHSFQ